MSDVPVVGQKTPQTRGKKKGCKTQTSWNISFQFVVFKEGVNECEVFVVGFQVAIFPKKTGRR